MKAANDRIAVRDLRTMPIVWIQRALFEQVKPTSNGYMAYLALSYFAVESKCRHHGIRQMASLVGVSETTMKSGLAELIERKAVLKRSCWKKTNGTRQALPNEYILIDLGQVNRQPI